MSRGVFRLSFLAPCRLIGSRSKTDIPCGEADPKDEAINDVSGNVGDGDTQTGLLKTLQRMMLGNDDDEEKAHHTTVEHCEDDTDRYC